MSKKYGKKTVNLWKHSEKVDYLPENDRVRYTISPDARKEILKLLLHDFRAFCLNLAFILDCSKTSQRLTEFPNEQ